MRRFVPVCLALCALPALSPAADAPLPPLSCAAPRAPDSVPPFEPAEARDLTYRERHDLQRLFKMLDGRWQGPLRESVCMLSGAGKQHHYQADLLIHAGHDRLDIRGDYRQTRQRVTRRFNRQLYLTADGLRVDLPSRAGEVELVEVGPRRLVYVSHYRVGFRQPAGKGQDGQGGQSGQGAQTGNGVAYGAVTGATVQVAVLPAAAEDNPQPRPRRASLIRRQRVTVELLSSRRLQITEQYFTQGAYSGSMNWQLRRQ